MFGCVPLAIERNERRAFRLQQPSGFHVSIEDELEAMVLAVVNHEMSFDDLVGWLKLRIARI